MTELEKQKLHSIAAELSRGDKTFPERAELTSQLMAMFAEKDAEIARLRIQLDVLEGTNVVMFLQQSATGPAVADMACGLYAAEPEGTVLRATDTGNEWIKSDGRFEPR